MHSQISCPSCGTLHQSAYCHHCGEKRFTQQDLSIWSFYTHVLDALLNLDSKVWKTINWLFTRPGKLTHRFIVGDRINTMRPMQLFAIANLIFYLALFNISMFFTRIDAMSGGYENYVEGTNYFHVNIGKIINAKSQQYAMEPPEISRQFEKLANKLSKLFLFFLVPVWGWCM